MTFMEVINTIIEEEVEFEELFEYLDDMQVESKADILMINREEY